MMIRDPDAKFTDRCSSWLVNASAGVLLCNALAVFGQAQQQTDVQEQVRKLSDAMNRLQMQIEQSQQELVALRTQLAAIQGAAPSVSMPTTDQTLSNAAELQAAVASLRESQSVHETQLATLEQTKVESESKYPLKLSGLILMTGITSTQAVDMAQTPTIAVHGPGSTSATIRQTILGVDARGPHLLGAVSHADMRFDFWGASGGSGYNAYSPA